MSELDKTIEELEAEVMGELEEGMHDAPKRCSSSRTNEKSQRMVKCKTLVKQL